MSVQRLRFYLFHMLMLVVALTAAGCELSSIPRATPTIAGTPPTETSTATAEPSPTVAPTQTTTQAPRLATNTLTATPSEPTITWTPSPTPGPMAYVVQPGDTYYVIMDSPPFNYTTAQATTLINEFLRINPGIRSIDQIPSPGSTIYIPLLPPTPTPVNFDQTQTAQPPGIAEITLPENAEILQIPIQENDSILRFAQEYDTNLPILATLNPQLRFRGCDFSNPSGGPGCNVFMVVGQTVNVPAPTATPTLSPTPSGNETATPTPIHEAPALIFPPQNGSAPARTFQLQWISIGELQPNEVYFVEIQDVTANIQAQDVTRSTYYMLPESLVPTDGQPHTIQWRVTVAASTSDGTYVLVGAPGDWRTFVWQSR